MSLGYTSSNGSLVTASGIAHASVHAQPRSFVSHWVFLVGAGTGPHRNIAFYQKENGPNSISAMGKFHVILFSLKLRKEYLIY